jgi:predicted DNA-binding protein (MmcQ/YjbR family)
MTPRRVRELCLSFPGAAESVQWGEDHVFKVGGKMFAVIGMMDGRFRGLSFKCAPESFMILTRVPGIVPAPYLARANWVAIAKLRVLPSSELRAYLRRAYEIVRAGLPKKLRHALSAGP